MRQQSPDLNRVNRSCLIVMTLCIGTVLTSRLWQTSMGPFSYAGAFGYGVSLGLCHELRKAFQVSSKKHFHWIRRGVQAQLGCSQTHVTAQLPGTALYSGPRGETGHQVEGIDCSASASKAAVQAQARCGPLVLLGSWLGSESVWSCISRAAGSSAACLQRPGKRPLWKGSGCKTDTLLHGRGRGCAHVG